MKKRNLHMDSLQIVKARVHHQYSKFDIFKELLLEYCAQNLNIIHK